MQLTQVDPLLDAPYPQVETAIENNSDSLSHQPVDQNKPDHHTYAIEGFVWLFGEADLVQDEIMPGAIQESLKLNPDKTIMMLFQHDPASVIGRWTSIYETSSGVYAEGLINLNVQRGRELAALISSGGINGLSVGFQTRRAKRDQKTGRRQIFALDLWEISVVTFPMLQSARLNVVPSFPT